MSETNERPANGASVGMVEVETEGLDKEGNLVIDDVVAAVDSNDKIVATDETITVVTAEGTIVVDETLSVAGDDGELHAVEEDISLLEVDDE